MLLFYHGNQCLLVVTYFPVVLLYYFENKVCFKSHVCMILSSDVLCLKEKFDTFMCLTVVLKLQTTEAAKHLFWNS